MPAGYQIAACLLGHGDRGIAAPLGVLVSAEATHQMPVKSADASSFTIIAYRFLPEIWP